MLMALQVAHNPAFQLDAAMPQHTAPAPPSECSVQPCSAQPGVARCGGAAPPSVVGDCRSALLPLYSFPAHPAAKMARVDSMPCIPGSPMSIDDGSGDDHHSSTSPCAPASLLSSAAPSSDDEDTENVSASGDAVVGRAARPRPHHHSRYASGAAPAVPSLHLSSPSLPAAVAVAGPRSARLAPRRVPSDPYLDSAGGAASSGGSDKHPSLLSTTLRALWEDRSDQGLFRYDVADCPSRVLPGAWGFVAQLNEGRATKKRATEFKLDEVAQAFDPAKFNFKKALLNEVLLQFEPAAGAAAAACRSGDCTGGAQLSLRAPAAAASPNLVLINVSPIEHGHVLLVPRVLDDLPQAVDERTALLALQFAREYGGPYVRVGFNSLGAYGTVNHLHFHAYQVPCVLPCERAGTAPLPGGDAAAVAACQLAAGGLKRRRVGAAVRVSRITDYPVRGWVIEAAPGSAEAHHPLSDATLEQIACLAGRACVAMRRANVPHNMLVSAAGARVFLWPQRYSELQASGAVAARYLDTGVNPAAFEIAGHLLLKRQVDYDVMDERFASELLGQVSLPQEHFEQLEAECFGVPRP